MGLDPGHDPELLEGLREKLAAGGRGLVEGLGVEDRRREVVSGAGGLEQHLAVCPAVLLRVLDADSLKARADGRGPLVTRGDALAGGADEGAHALKLDLLSGGEEGAVVAGGGAPGGPPVRRSRLDLSGHAATSSRASTRSLDGEGHGGAHQGAGPDRHGSRPHPTIAAPGSGCLGRAKAENGVGLGKGRHSFGLTCRMGRVGGPSVARQGHLGFGFRVSGHTPRKAAHWTRAQQGRAAGSQPNQAKTRWTNGKGGNGNLRRA
mmetsp:Transcript_58175/g.185211  ORF Transcript_58175/g.185211 Transcript_58175/m.185211 type:complete len:263 (+) Transcript_58175:1721-2509(+)